MERFCERHKLGRARKNGYTDAHPTKKAFVQKMLPQHSTVHQISLAFSDAYSFGGMLNDLKCQRAQI
jgi:hypothetical protein